MTKSETKSDPEESNRLWASASFVGVLIVIGLPLWWKTTEVYRVALPYDKISNFDSLKLEVATELTILANDVHTAKEIAGVLEKSFKDEYLIKLNISYQIQPDELHHTVNVAADDEEALDAVVQSYPVEKHNHLYVIQRKPLQHDVWLSTQRVVFFRDLKASQTLVKVLKRWVYQSHILHGSVATNEADSARRTRFGPGASYQVVLSVAHPRPDVLDVDFNAAEAVEDYLGTFVDELSVLHNFTLKSQWLHLLDFDFQAKQIKDPNNEWGHHYAVNADRLPLILTTLESRAATRASQDPTINLALYVLPCRMSPLKIYDNENPIEAPTQAFLSPKWGGVVITHPTWSECREEMEGRSEKSTFRPQVRVIMGTFLAQLRELLGIAKPEGIDGAYLVPLTSTAPRLWELDALLRSRVVEQVTSAQLTLTSLAQLLGEISNIVINDEVGASIKSSVHNIEEACRLLGGGHLVDAYRTSRAAFLAAEEAFTDPSLLALLYFPDDQKYAIYIPLFLPIMFPVVLSLKNLLLLRKNNQQKQKID